MDIFLVRHGETKFFKEKRIQTPDAMLNKYGMAQAREVAKRTRFRNIDRVISSPWSRARKTGEIIAKEIDRPHEVFEGIHEGLSPSIYGEKRDGEVIRKFRKGYIKNMANLDWKYGKQEESRREVIKRAFTFQKHLIKKHLNEKILVVSHGVIIKTFITCAILGENFDDKTFSKVYYSLNIDTTGISLLQYREKQKRWVVYYINDHAHLANIPLSI